jgi:hypothetical protein
MTRAALHLGRRGSAGSAASVLLACAAFALPACGGSEPPPSVAGAAPQAAAGTATAAAESRLIFAGDLGLESLETIPSQDQMDAEAAKRVNEQNADAVFEQLRAELDADPDTR